MSFNLSPRQWRRRLSRWLFAGALAATAQFALADAEWAAAWGPSLGSSIPLLAADDQNGESQTLDTLKGSNGVLLVFNRSVDW